MFGVYLGNPGGGFGAGSNFWYPDSTGRIKPGEAHPEFIDALTTWARWYQEGFISPDFAAMDVGRGEEDIVAGRVGTQPWLQWNGWVNSPHLVALWGDEAYQAPILFPVAPGVTLLGQANFASGTITVVSKDFNNPAALMKMLSLADDILFCLDSVLTDEEFHDYTAGRREWAPVPFRITDPQTDILQYQHVVHALRTGDRSQLLTAGMQLKHNESRMWMDDRNPNGLGSWLQMGRVEGSAYSANMQLIDNGLLIRNSLWGPPPVEFDSIMNPSAIILTGVTQIIQGVRPVSDWPSILDEWYAAGGQAMEDAVNNQYR
jgi:putative aldouronate transport system substrate-binding protein